MRRGKAIHQAIEAACITGVAPTIPEALQGWKWATARWQSHGLMPERPIGIDPKTGEATAYPTREDIPGHHVAVIVDVHAMTGAEAFDYKTGSQFSKFDYSHQARLNGYSVAALYGRDEIETGLAYLTADGVAPKSWMLDQFDLAHQQEKLRVWSEAAPTAEPTPCSACRYCQAKSICPAMKESA